LNGFQAHVGLEMTLCFSFEELAKTRQNSYMQHFVNLHLTRDFYRVFSQKNFSAKEPNFLP
jgi:hypothetical protein